MDTIRINNRPEPHIMLPTHMAQSNDECYIGALTGYYVPNSNYYNILPNDAKIDPERVSVVGYVFSSNIFKSLGEEIFEQIVFLNVNTDATLTAAERFLKKSKTNNTTPIEKKLTDIHRLKEKLQDTFLEVPSDWWEAEFIPAINNGESHALVGYWEDNKLHIVQLKTMHEVQIDTYALKLDVFSRNTGILESSIMLNKGALFIGCGSVGSLVAVELAKAGVGRFMLVDNDIFGYHNICRHQCGIYDVGRYKTDAVADRILQINPYATIVKKNSMIQEVDREEISSFCNPDTIVIGGADNREGDLYANQFAIEIGMPFMSIGCWERAFAGEIFYCLPTGMPTYEDFLSVVGFSSGRVTQNRRFYTTEEELEKVSFEPGISADVNFVTIIAVKIALDLLNRNTPEYTQRLVPNLTQYTLVCNTNNPHIGGEQAEIFSYPLQVTTSIIVPYSKKD